MKIQQMTRHKIINTLIAIIVSLNVFAGNSREIIVGTGSFIGELILGFQIQQVPHQSPQVIVVPGSQSVIVVPPPPPPFHPPIFHRPLPPRPIHIHSHFSPVHPPRPHFRNPPRKPRPPRK